MRLLLVLVGCVSLLGAPSAAQAVTVGISHQTADAFGDQRLRALGLQHARLVVPWDAATSEPARVAEWLRATSAAGMRPHVAFEHARSTRCPARPCSAPARAQYARAVRKFLATFPQVRTFSTWNEANHRSQPVASRPELVAGYYEELRAACGSCTVVAASVLDSGSYVRWLERFRDATDLEPRLWGLHNYGDATYGRSTGTDAVLGAVPGKVWVEETGGIVRIAGSALLTDEIRAANSIKRAFALAATRPRISRMYIYQWRAGARDRFDAGLVRPDGTERPSLTALARALAAQAAPTLRWRARGRGRRLVLRATCLAASRRCRGRVLVRIGGRGVAKRRYRTSSRRRTTVLRVRIPRVLRRLRCVRLVVRATSPAAATTRASLIRR